GRDRSVMTMFTEPRERLIKWVCRQLTGPPDSTSDSPVLRGVFPTERFPCGALYPTSEWGEGIDPASEDMEEASGTTKVKGETSAEPAVVRRYIPPSSLGFSFFIKGEDIRFQVLCNAVSYEHKKKDGKYTNNWTRKELVSGQGDDESQDINCPGKDDRFSKLEGRAHVDIQWRHFADGWIVTVSLCNVQELDEDIDPFERSEKTLFEASLGCVIEAGDVGVYPRVDRSLLNDEEQEIELQYAHRHIYAIGHGCAANWEYKDGKIVELHSDTMPAVEVPQMTADTGSGGEPVLSLARLAKIDNEHASLLPELDGFISGYASWVAKQEGEIPALPADDREAASRIVERMNTAVS
ncbi:uncharacterized protein METZ01_LOCUS258429, partial [marine metagenome]